MRVRRAGGTVGPSASLALAAGGVLLAGPVALSFFTGGYFGLPRLWAALVVSVLVVVAALTLPDVRLRGRPALLAVGGLLALAGWSLLSLGWAPIAATAYGAGERLILYAGVLVAALLLLRRPALLHATSPALAAGALAVTGYGLSERLLPGLLHFSHSTSAAGRLEQPLTYWNAMGELAAIGLVLALVVGGDTRRGVLQRAAALAACAPLGLGLYLSFSRGALFAAAAGVLTLLVATPSRALLRTTAVGLAAAVLAAVAAAPSGAVTSLTGSLATRERQGAITLVLLLAISAAAALAGVRLQRREPAGSLRLPRRAPWLAAAAVCAGLAVAILAGASETSGHLSTGATRLTTLRSDRYDYWRVAVRAFAQEPVRGVGAGGWAVKWLRWRPYDVGAADAHSLPLQTAAELGVVGLLLLGLLLWGVGGAAARALGADRAAAAGPLAGFVTYIAHAPLDWDWEMPALTGFGLILAGALLAQAHPRAAGARPVMRGRVERALLVAAAVLAAAWFASQLRSLHEQSVVRAALHAHPVIGAAEARALDDRISQARLLNPDRGIDTLAVYVQVQQHRFDRAVALAQRVAEEEPENPSNWLVLQFIAGSSGSHANLYRLASAQLRRLAPPVPSAR